MSPSQINARSLGDKPPGRLDFASVDDPLSADLYTSDLPSSTSRRDSSAPSERNEIAKGGVVIAIPVLNEEVHIAEICRQLAIDLPNERTVRFVVVDGGSIDRTPEIVAELVDRARDTSTPIDCIANPHRFQSAAVNMAAATMQPHETFLIRADAHAQYPPGFVSSIVKSLETTRADAIVIPMDSFGETPIARAIAWVSDTPVGSGGSPHRGGSKSGPVDHGHHAGWRVAAFRHVGGYDPSFSHNEDAELDCRLRRANSSIWLDANARITYFVRPTFAALFRQYRNYGRGRSRTVRRHPGSIRSRQIIALCLPWAPVLAALVGVVNPLAWLLTVGYFGALAYASLSIALSRRSACGLLAGPVALTMHTAWSLGFIEGLLTIRQSAWRPHSASCDS